MTPNNSTAFNALKTNPWDSKIAFLIDTFDAYQLPGNQLFTANNKNISCWKIAIETSTQHREAQRMVWTSELRPSRSVWESLDDLHQWLLEEHLEWSSRILSLHISWYPNPPRQDCFLWCPRFNRFVHWHADLQYIIMEWCAIVEQHSYDIVI